jgi:hypothetical protein
MSGPVFSTPGQRRRLSRFGLRTLIVLFTVAVCLIPVVWNATKTQGEDDAARRYVRLNGKKFGNQSVANATAVFPFVLQVTVDHHSYLSLPWSNKGLIERQQIEEFYCVWLFGIVVRVPLTTSLGNPTSSNLGSTQQNRPVVEL